MMQKLRSSSGAVAAGTIRCDSSGLIIGGTGFLGSGTSLTSHRPRRGEVFRPLSSHDLATVSPSPQTGRHPVVGSHEQGDDQQNHTAPSSKWDDDKGGYGNGEGEAEVITEIRGVDRASEGVEQHALDGRHIGEPAAAVVCAAGEAGSEHPEVTR